MTDYAGICDPANPFNTTGLSDEDRALLDYVMAMKAAGLDVVVTATTDHPKLTSSGNVSRHRMMGTNGEGLAIDARMRTRGTDIHRAVFDGFALVEKQLHELIYSGAPYSIKAGKRVTPYAVAAHHDHVHVSVSRGVFVKFPTTPPQPSPWKWSTYMPGPLDITSAAPCTTGGYWQQSAEGGIYAFDGAAHHDAYNAHPELGGNVRHFVALIGTSTGGYVQISSDGARYRWDPK